MKTGVDELPSNATDAVEPSHPPQIPNRACLVSFMRGTRDVVHVTDVTTCVMNFMRNQNVSRLYLRNDEHGFTGWATEMKE